MKREPTPAEVSHARELHWAELNKQAFDLDNKIKNAKTSDERLTLQSQLDIIIDKLTIFNIVSRKKK
jgi:hypothetical protein